MGERVPSGIAGLDEILNGGYPRHTMVMLAGEPGTGKTTAALQFVLAGAARGESGLFLSLSQSEPELRLIAQSHGYDLSGMAIHSPTVVDRLDEQSFSVDTSESQLVELLRDIYETLDRVQPSLFVFDSLLELRLLALDDMSYRREMLALRRYLASKNVTTLLVDHLDRPGTDRQIEGIVHASIRLEGDAPPIGIMRRRLFVTKMRGCAFREGYHDFRIRPGGLAVFPRIVPALTKEADIREPLRTGHEALDRMLGGGLEFGTTALIAGQAGTGKSTLATLFAISACRAGRNAALFLFEERPEILRVRSESVGLNVGPAEREGRMYMQHFDPAEVSPGEFSHAVIDAVDAGAAVIVIDSLSGYLNALPHRESVVTHLHSLLQFLARRGVLVIVTMAQQGLLGEPPRSDVDTSYIADSILLLRHYAAGSQIRRSVAVLKKRHSEHDRSIRELTIRPGAVEIADLTEDTLAMTRGSGLVGEG